MVEIFCAKPEVCPDGVTRTWHHLTVTDDEYAADPAIVGFSLQAADLADLAEVLQAVAAAVTA
jgi:hypothetical protein